MSDVQTRPTSFFDLFLAGKATADQVDDFAGAWHGSGDQEQRRLSSYLGFTDAEWDIYVLDHRLLPDLAMCRRNPRPFTTIVANYVARLRERAGSDDAPSLFALTRWLHRHGVNT
ncbi:MAG TPA: hypothetical protein VFG62_24090 [Rhodopila sp.]|jgi:hypothetical protein|nr:hypothetical protein [Rhodopila sp.]